MPAYNFQEQFAEDIEVGRKRQTIRRKRKRPTRPGDTLYLYTGLRTKRCRKLREAVCKSVVGITISPAFVVTLGGLRLYWSDATRLAQDDGFNNLVDFCRFFERHYGLPFGGELIKW